MTVALTMPRLGETVTEGTVIRWLKKEGDFVNKDENIVEVSTAKVETEIPAPSSGKVSKIVAHEDETVPVGAELAEIDETAVPGAPPAEAKPPEEAEAPPAPTPTPAPAPAPAAAPAAPPEAKPPEKAPEVGFISPVVRKLAREHDIDLSKVTGTGASGRITRQDVERYIELQKPAAPAPPKPPIAEAPPVSLAPMPAAKVPEYELPGVPAVEAERPAAPAPPAEAAPAAPPKPAPAEARPPEVAPPPAAPAYPGERIVPIPHLRREISKHMVNSKRVSAHVTAIVEVDMTNVAKQREQAKEAFKKREGFSLTYLPFVAKAAIDALLNFPTLNARIVDEHNMALHDYVNLGIAVAVEDGLIVPVIKGADGMSLIGLARAIHDLADKARSERLSPDDVTGSTFTITNPGSFGSVIQTPIINQPNVAILSLEMIQRRPIVIDEAIAIRQMVFMPLSYDHRLIDGAVAAQFLNRIKHNLETWDFSPELAKVM
ncbi:MAG TPA: dihydrolipoamide acetyltransferase family protein [Anaerolineae bacterium]|nr:dihydrolipoamide acetyltransferase family protein [Anaerolineae bacterium]